MPSLAKVPFKPWEPEESVGLLWDAFVARGRAAPRNAVAAVGLDEMAGRLAVLFRGLGGEHGVEIKQAVPTGSAPSSARASFDGETLRLPACIDWSPERALNEGFYLWLTAACALSAPPSRTPDDPLQADLEQVRRSRHTTEAVLESCRGLAGLHDRLAAACLAMRPPPRRGCREERALDAVVRSLLGAGEPPHDALARHYAASVAAPEAALDALRAPRGYRRFQPPPLWPERRTPPPRTAPSDRADDQDGPAETAAEKKGLFRAKRRRGDQAERKDGLLLHRFESFLSWSEFLNLNRRVEDDDEDAAKKAADDHQDLSLTRSGRAAKTRLTLHLDLAPEDVERERLSGERLYPEWDYRRGAYWPAHCRVLDSPLEAGETMPGVSGDPAARRRIRAVKRQLEALRPRRVVLPRQTDGEELDIDAVVRARADFRASGELPDRLYQATRSAERDLAVAILIDSSRSTEAAVGPSSVIEIAREALAALAWGLRACGDDCAIYAFSSLRRDRVYVQTCKTFDEAMSAGVEARIGRLRPSFYTRLGAAMRHVAGALQSRSQSRRLLLVLTDGKPNDLDHYEGRYGVEDSRKAVLEARRLGQSVFGVTIDSKSRSHFSRIFGPGGFAIVQRPERLTAALPALYRHLVHT